MPRASQNTVLSIVVMCIALRPIAASADDLTLDVEGYGGWPDAVAALQHEHPG